MIPALDEWIAGFGGGGAAMALLAALLLGLRHAADPDHVTAVAALMLSRDEGREADAGFLGLWWGLGHAVTILALGMPVVFFGRLLPESVHTAAEVAVGLLIVALAVRLLVRWQRGYLHAHPHRHAEVVHSHLHLHEHRHETEDAVSHGHAHSASLGRSPFESFGIGLVHGVGGSAGAGVLLIASAQDPRSAILALLLFACGTAASMTILSALMGRFLVRRSVSTRMESMIPALGAVGFLFGVWYALGALELLPYVF